MLKQRQQGEDEEEEGKEEEEEDEEEEEANVEGDNGNWRAYMVVLMMERSVMMMIMEILIGLSRSAWTAEK